MHSSLPQLSSRLSPDIKRFALLAVHSKLSALFNSAQAFFHASNDKTVTCRFPGQPRKSFSIPKSLLTTAPEISSISPRDLLLIAIPASLGELFNMVLSTK